MCISLDYQGAVNNVAESVNEAKLKNGLVYSFMLKKRNFFSPVVVGCNNFD